MALSIFIGAVSCRLWLLRSMGGDTITISGRLWRLLTISAAVLVASSLANLTERSAEMSGLGITAILPVLPTVIFKSHFGSMWLVKVAALTSVWVSWLATRHHKGSRMAVVFMFHMGVLITFSLSASGHASDFGDLSFQQLIDWLHFLTSALWSGTLLALAFVILPVAAEMSDAEEKGITGIAGRFYSLSWPVLAAVILSGLYNSVVEVGSFQALVATSYGRILSAKLLFLLFLAVRYVVFSRQAKDAPGYAGKFLRRVKTDAIVIFFVVLCVALLSHAIPGRHASHVSPNQHMEDHHMEGM